MGYVFAYLMIIPLWPVFAMWRGYAIATLWGWFVVPGFGVAPLSIYTAIGVLLVVGALKSVDYSHDERETSEKFFYSISLGLLGPALMLGTGWVWKWLQWGVIT
jgi:hypothetical protein